MLSVLVSTRAADSRHETITDAWFRKTQIKHVDCAIINHNYPYSLCLTHSQEWDGGVVGWSWPALTNFGHGCCSEGGFRISYHSTVCLALCCSSRAHGRVCLCVSEREEEWEREGMCECWTRRPSTALTCYGKAQLYRDLSWLSLYHFASCIWSLKHFSNTAAGVKLLGLESTF